MYFAHFSTFNLHNNPISIIDNLLLHFIVKEVEKLNNLTKVKQLLSFGAGFEPRLPDSWDPDYCNPLTVGQETYIVDTAPSLTRSASLDMFCNFFKP